MKIKFNFQVLFLLLFILTFAVLAISQGLFSLSAKKIPFSSLIPADVLYDDAWYGIYLENSYIGYSHFQYKVENLSDGGGFSLKNISQLNLPFLDAVQPISVDSQIYFLDNYRIREAAFKLASPGYTISGKLVKKHSSAYELTINTPAQAFTKEVTLDDELITSFVSPFSLPYLPSHQQATLSLYDPFFDRKSQIHLIQSGKQPLEIDGKFYEATVVEFDYEGMEGKVYLDASGKVLKKEMLGFVFLKQDPGVLFQESRDFAIADISDTYSIGAETLRSPETMEYIKVKVTGITSDCIVSDENQEVTVADDGFIVVVRKHRPVNVVTLPCGLPPCLEEPPKDQFIQSEAAEVKATAVLIAGSEKNSFRILELLSSWIDQNIEKTPTLSIPNTLDTLKLKRGDCGELSALMAGFLRSLGIPAYVNIGLVYNEGRFFYHAWVSAFVGDWIETDPALTQLIADPTHITFFKGLENQFKIIKIINRVGLEVLKYQ